MLVQIIRLAVQRAWRMALPAYDLRRTGHVAGSRSRGRAPRARGARVKPSIVLVGTLARRTRRASSSWHGLCGR